MTNANRYISASGRLTSPWRQRSREILTDGHDVVIFPSGALADISARIAQKLQQNGVPAKVIHARHLANLDAGRLSELAQKFETLVVLTLDAHRPATHSPRVVADSNQRAPATVHFFDEHSKPPEDDLTTTANADTSAGGTLGLVEGNGQHQLSLFDTDWTFDAAVASAPRLTPDDSACSYSNRSANCPDNSLQRELEEVQSTTISPDVKEWSDLYSRVGRRASFLWKWATRGVELTTLPCVDPKWRSHVRDTKVLSIILCVLLDDIADVERKHSFLETLLHIVQCQKMPDPHTVPESDREYAAVTLELTNRYEQRIRQYPAFAFYQDLLQYDLMQYINTMRYAALVNGRPYLINPAEHELYFPHNMHMMSFATLDLMCSPTFQVSELGRVREAVWHGQCMGRIGNLLATWRRELAQGDFTSDIFAWAVAEGDLTINQLSVQNRKEIDNTLRTGKYEQYFHRRWRIHRDRFRAIAAAVESVDLFECLRGHERFFRMHMASRGLI